MSKIIAAVLALSVVAAAATASYAFDAKTFWSTHEHENGAQGN